ncbi:ROK family protein [Tolumonas lignilytica]|uniref:ROK family protein n=1 Tax=Tolumonas lignilytica TaxID=1283284 RepID=UPI0004642A8C|nr:ROK family protein [Tolumonas lignilytica]
MKYLAIDVGGSAIKYALLDHQANSLEKGEIPTPQERFDLFQAEIVKLYQQYQTQISGIAFSLPGIIDSEQGRSITGGSLSYNKNRDFVAEMEKHCHIPITIENDAKCAALAEAWKGSLAECQNGVVVVLGTGVGGGVILNGQLYKGAHFASGELSFLLTDSWHCKGEPYHYWGHDGGVRGLCRAVEHIKRLPAKSVTGKQVFAWVNEGDADVCEALDAYTYRLAMQLFNLQALFDPELIAIGGGISAQPLLLQYINQNIAYLEETLPMRLITPKVVRCHFMNDANLVGALYHHILTTETPHP